MKGLLGKEFSDARYLIQKRGKPFGSKRRLIHTSRKLAQRDRGLIEPEGKPF
jgi:hypothetical protein